MGLMTLGEFQDDLRDALERPSLDVTRINRWVNAAIKEIGYAFKFAELQGSLSFTTVAGTESYALATIASDFRMLAEDGLLRVAPSDRLGKLKKETRTQWRLRRKDTTDNNQRGMPEWYHRYAGSLYLRPIPDGTDVDIEGDYWKLIENLSDPDSVTVFSEDWDDIVFTGALYRGFRASGEHDRWVNARNDFLGLVRSRSLEDDIEEFAQGGLNIVQSDSALVDGSDG